MSDFGDLETSEPSAARERMGRYELVSEIASGGMGSVFLARLLGDADVSRVVAIKRIHPHLARTQGVAEMFLDEARIAARIDHPNVCQVYEYGREAGSSFLAMEFLAGESLLGVVRRLAMGRTSVEPVAHAARVAFVMAEVCDGLHAAHEVRDANGEPLNVVHRDVSPHNVFITFDGAVKVVDFGIASASSRLHHTETGTIKGKFAYMAPEQLQGMRADRRADVWAVGVVLWELLALKRLFRHENPSAVVQAVENQHIERPSEALLGLPLAFDDIVLRALERDPTRRTPTAQALSTELRDAVHRLGVKVDRGEIATWMAALFPDGAQRRERWIREAHATSATPSSPQRVGTPSDAPTRSEPRGPERLPTGDAPSQGTTPRAASGMWVALALLVALVALLTGLGAFAFWTQGSAPASRDLSPAAASRDAGPRTSEPDAANEATRLNVGVGASADAGPADPSDAGRRRATRDAEVHPDSPLPIQASPVEAPTGPACLKLGAGVSLEFEGSVYEGPRARCIEAQAGEHTIRLTELATGTVLWDGPLTLRAEEERILTRRSRM